MKAHVTDRYEQADDGTLLIDVAADGMEDLYHRLDRSAPYVRRDLDQDLVDFLIGCARELVDEKFGLRFTLAKPLDEKGEGRVRRSVNRFFLYLVEKERNLIAQMIRKSLVLMVMGIAILFMAVYFNQWLGDERSVAADVFGEGLTVAAWVALWEALATFIVEWFPHRRNVQLYGQLARAPLQFRVEPEAIAPAA